MKVQINIAMIEISGSNRRLTKSLVKQMKSAPKGAIENGIAIGYVVNCLPDSYKTLILYYKQEYFTFSCEWKWHSETKIWKEERNRLKYIEFHTEIGLTIFWEAYVNLRNSPLTQIYL